MHRIIRCIQYWVTFVLDVLFPPTDEQRMVRRLSSDELLKARVHSYRNGVTCLLPFSDMRVRALIHEAKFHGNEKAFALLGSVLAEHLKTLENSKDMVIIPIPLSKERFRERGFNQCTEMIRCALKSNQFLFLEDKALIRVRNTQPQTKLTKDARHHNVKDAFSVIRPEKIEGKHVVLVDDVTTTGATIQSAKIALLQHSPSKVICIAIAH